MAMTCSICKHPKRKEIDRAILNRESVRDIARRFPPITRPSVQRHKVRCASTAIERAEVNQAFSIAGQMRDLCLKAAATLEKANKGGKINEIAIASREARETLMALAKLTGELDESTRVNVMIAQREAQEGEQLIMLERLTIEERLQLSALIAKAQGEEDLLAEDVSSSSALTDGRQSADAED